jgi:Ulp1 family protease
MRLWKLLPTLFTKKIFFPVNIKNTHWCLIELDTEESEIRMKDSFKWKNATFLSRLQGFLERMGEKMHPNMKKWHQSKIKEGTEEFITQKDSVSCGVLTCWYGYILGSGKKLEHWENSEEDTLKAWREVYTTIMVSIIGKKLTMPSTHHPARTTTIRQG